MKGISVDKENIAPQRPLPPQSINPSTPIDFTPKTSVFYLDLLDNPLLPRLIKYVLQAGGVSHSVPSILLLFRGVLHSWIEVSLTWSLTRQNQLQRHIQRPWNGPSTFGLSKVTNLITSNAI